MEINFEFQPHFKSCFENLDPEKIIQQIELTTNTDINTSDTLLFLDEIQESSQALKSLRYFYEKMPNLHVIAAGSLLEFMLHAEKASNPVGRIQNIYLLPLSFGEFLDALNENKLRTYLKNFSLKDNISESLHQKCIDYLKTFLYLGGMPEIVSFWLKSTKFTKIDQLHLSLLQNFKNDFAKYDKHVNFHLLEKVFTKAPGTVGTKFKYSHIDNSISSRDIKKSLELLIKAQILHRIFATSGSALPLGAHRNEKKFKILFLDVGLLQSAMGISSETFLSNDLLAVYKGAVAEQFVGQELLTLKKVFEEPYLYYWMREKKNSSAEIDYLWQKGENIFPVEVTFCLEKFYLNGNIYNYDLLTLNFYVK